MKDLRILVGRHYGLESKHLTSMTLDAILPILRTKFKVKIIWFFYMPERINSLLPKDLDAEVMDIHDFDNALDVLKKSRPDIVIDNEYPSLMDLAIDAAAKYLNIPVITRVNAVDDLKVSKIRFLTAFLPQFFQSRMPYESNNKKQFMRRGKFFLFKYRFLLKTWNACGIGMLKIMRNTLITLDWHISNKLFLDHRFANTLHYLESENLLERMIKKGFSRSNLIVTGNPIYDEVIKKYQHYTPSPKNNEKIRILFVPIQHYEGGFWTKKERDLTIKEIIKTILAYKNEFSLTVKLHPSSMLYQDYETIIHKIDPTIPIYQKGTIYDFLDESDLIISFSPVTAALIYPLIAKKPLVVCNFFNFNYLNKIENGVAWECKDPSELIQIIKHALSTHAQYQKNIEQYLTKFIYTLDGRASERICNAITKLVDKC